MEWPVLWSKSTMTAEQEDLQKLKTDVTEIKVDVLDLKSHRTICNEKHESANKHRRESDKEMINISTTLNSTLETNKEILSLMKEYAPTVKRAKDAHTTTDKLKDYAIWVAALSAGGAGLHYWTNLFS